MSLFDMLFGSQSQMKQLPTMTPQQQQLIQSLFSGLQGGESNLPGMSYLQGILSGDPEAFKEFEAPALRQFNEQVVPGIAERFSGMGAGGRKSSAFQSQLATAGSKLSENLSAQRANLKQGAMSQLQGLLGMSMQPQFENVYMQGQQGLMSPLLQGLGSGFGMGGGFGGLAKLLGLFGGGNNDFKGQFGGYVY